MRFRPKPNPSGWCQEQSQAARPTIKRVDSMKPQHVRAEVAELETQLAIGLFR